NKLAHAYLFCGPRGVGKTTCARIFAKTINCFHRTADNEACNECESCVAFNEQRSYNIHELDAASNNSVDDIRQLIDQVRIPPQIGKYNVYIIDEVHMLSTAAFNSFLKTLEEPPAHAIFILATTEKHKIIPTILSRCQVYDFNRITVADIVRQLQYIADREGVNAEPEALNVIAQKADGGMRDALSIFDQVVSYTSGNITYRAVIENLNVLDYEYYFRLTDAILSGSVVDCLLILNDILNHGFEGQYVITGITSHFRDLLVCKDAQTAKLFEVGASIRDRYIETAKRCSNEFLYQAIEIANDCDLNYRLSKNKRLMLELAFIRLCQLSDNSAPVSSQQTKNALKPVEPSSRTLASDPKNGSEPAAQSPSKVSEGTENVLHEPDSASTESYQSDTRANEANLRTTRSAKEPVKKASSSLDGIGVSISSLRGKKDAHQNAASNSTPATKTGRSDQYSEKELIDAWNAFTAGLTEEKLLQNAMNLYKPQMLNESLFEVKVSTEISKQFLEDNSLRILSFLREKLGNDDITMILSIAETSDIKKPLSQREIFDAMVDENPALQKLSDEFGLELS
ncbi:MAG TPA: DNA polymerase III subunit gamma/tau, partial [Dysgonamonadaceae bacterium]|nr:DNA polymerase III subunit gamma/tau [Dysgonamonadaceae bacterium]